MIQEIKKRASTLVNSLTPNEEDPVEQFFEDKEFPLVEVNWQKQYVIVQSDEERIADLREELGIEERRSRLPGTKDFEREFDDFTLVFKQDLGRIKIQKNLWSEGNLHVALDRFRKKFDTQIVDQGTLEKEIQNTRTRLDHLRQLQADIQ